MSNTKRKIAVSFMIALIMLLTAETTAPLRAQAQWSTFDFLTEAWTGISSVADVYQKVESSYLELKESVLDGLAWMLAKMLIQSLTASIVNWINSGFKGNPSFMAHPEGFFLDVADQATGYMISQNGPLSSLCSPFSLDLRLNLALGSTQVQRTKYACTLSTIINNVANAKVGASVNVTQNGQTIASAGAGGSINGFMGGDFSQGGWAAFTSMTTQAQNNYYGSYLQANSDMNEQIGKQTKTVNADLSMGGGFMSFKKCDNVFTTDVMVDPPDLIAEYENDPTLTRLVNSDGSITYQSCHTETPGSVIASSLNNQLHAGNNSLVTADEINEILSAALGQLMKSVLQGGLNSSSQPSSGATQSITQILQSDTTGLPISELITNLTNKIDQYIVTTQSYMDLRDQTLAAINDLQTYANDEASLCATNNHLSEQTAIDSISSQQIEPLQTKYQALSDDAASRMQTLTNIEASAKGAQSAGSLQDISQQFENMLSAGTVTTELDTNSAQTDLTSVQTSVSTIQNSIAVYHNTCIKANGTPNSSASQTGNAGSAPTISSVSISSGSIAGSGFTGTDAVYIISSNGTNTNLNYSVVSDSSITLSAPVPTLSSGTYNLFVGNKYGDSQPFSVTIL